MSESPTEHFEHAEHAEHVAHSGDPFLAKVSITIAALAVLAAAVGALETIETNDTIRDKTTAAIVQNKATDTWGEFSRQSIKKTMYDIAADGAADARRDALTAKSKDYEGQAKATQKRAESMETEVEAANAGSEHHEHRHQILTIATTCLHISIAMATIAIVMRGRKWPFYAAIALGVVGAIGAAFAYV
jgi:hypothetical protein